MSEPTYTEWKPVVDAHNHYETAYCPYCDNYIARMMKRFYTNRDGESEAQFRVECPLCKTHGKTYMHESVAKISWDGREHDGQEPDPYLRKAKRRFVPILR